MKYGIISDTHFTLKDDSAKIKNMIDQLQIVFKYADEILHAADLDEPFLVGE